MINVKTLYGKTDEFEAELAVYLSDDWKIENVGFHEYDDSDKWWYAILTKKVSDIS